MLKGRGTICTIGSRRQAFYDNFRLVNTRQVIDATSDGGLERARTSLYFEVLPTWLNAYILRRCVSRRSCIFGQSTSFVFANRKDYWSEVRRRLSERTRWHRELHDTFLQTIQGSKFVLDVCLKDHWTGGRCTAQWGQVSGWPRTATAEARAALNSLRSSTTLKNELDRLCGGLQKAASSPNG